MAGLCTYRPEITMQIGHAYGLCLDTKSEILPVCFGVPSRYRDYDSLKPALL